MRRKPAPMTTIPAADGKRQYRIGAAGSARGQPPSTFGPEPGSLSRSPSPPGTGTPPLWRADAEPSGCTSAPRAAPSSAGTDATLPAWSPDTFPGPSPSPGAKVYAPGVGRTAGPAGAGDGGHRGVPPNQPFTGLDSVAGDMDTDALAPEPFPQVRDVVCLVRVETLGLEIPASVGVASRLVTLDHGLQREAVMSLRRGEADEEGQSVRVRQDVHLGTRLAPVHGARTCEFAPFLALTCAESSTARVRSSRPASSRRCRISSWSRPQTPALDQIRNLWWATSIPRSTAATPARRSH